MYKNTFSKFCLKLFSRILGLDICCFILSAFGIASSGSQIIRVLIQLACIIGIISFLYPVCHQFGNLDAPMVTTGHKKYSPLKGLYASLVAYSPCLLSGIILIAFKILNTFPNFVNYYKIINSFYFPFLYSILPVNTTLSELSYSSIFLSVIILLVIPIMCLLSYILGLNRFSFAEKVFYKKKAS